MQVQVERYDRGGAYSQASREGQKASGAGQKGSGVGQKASRVGQKGNHGTGHTCRVPRRARGSSTANTAAYAAPRPLSSADPHGGKPLAASSRAPAVVDAISTASAAIACVRAAASPIACPTNSVMTSSPVTAVSAERRTWASK